MCDDKLKILLVEDDRVFQRIVHLALDERMEVLDAENGNTALRLAGEVRPNCVLLDNMLPDTTGLDLIRFFVERQIPVVMLTGEGSEEIAAEAMRCGASNYLTKQSMTAELLVRAIFEVMKSSPEVFKLGQRIRKHVLLIDDDDVDRLRVRRLMANRYELLETELGNEGLDVFIQERPDCVLLDYLLPDVDGLDLLDDLVRHEATVVMLTGQGSEQIAVEAMKHGAQDYLVKDKIDAESLRRSIDNSVEKCRMRQQILEQQEQLRQRAEELQRSNQELQQFAYVASHDLQEPLRSVSSFCNLLHEKYQGRFDGQADRWMGKIVRGSERMKTMINDLLTYSRVESRGADFQPTDCRRVFDNVTADLATAIRKSAGTITCGELPSVMADESQLAQLLQNLICNAIKYCGDEPPVVQVRAERDGDAWSSSVSDNGIGIEPEHYDRVFQMFKRLHTRDKYPGTGIGLALCQRIVHRHGGRIWVESQPGVGSTFHFTLPAIIEVEQEHESPAAALSAC